MFRSLMIYATLFVLTAFGFFSTVKAAEAAQPMGPGYICYLAPSMLEAADNPSVIAYVGSPLLPASTYTDGSALLTLQATEGDAKTTVVDSQKAIFRTGYLGQVVQWNEGAFSMVIVESEVKDFFTGFATLGEQPLVGPCSFENELAP